MTKKPAKSSKTAAKWDGSVPAAATAVVKRIEGFYSKPYDDNGGKAGGTWTIGYGSIVDKNGKPVTPSTPAVTESDAEALLTRDMKGAASDVAQRIQVELDTHEAAALISWTYNLGGGSLGKSSMLKKINAGDKTAVPDEMRKWIYQEGKPLLGLLRRRWAEAAIFRGVNATNATVLAWKDIDDLADWPDFP